MPACAEHPRRRLRPGRRGGSRARRRPGTGRRSGPAAAGRAPGPGPRPASSTAAAPSEICDEVPAVCRPPSSTGLSAASPSSVVSRRPWSRSTSAARRSAACPRRAPAPRRVMISRSNRPSAQACAALRCDRRPNASMSSRVMPRRLAIRSAPSNWFGQVDVPRRGPRAPLPPGTALAPSGIRLIDSTPQAMPTSMAPAAIRPAIRCAACCAAAALGVDGRGAGVLRQPGVQPGRPGDVVGLLAGLGDAAADDLLDQSPASMPARSSTPLCAAPSSSAACRPDSHAVALADRGAGGFDDHRVTHGSAQAQNTFSLL